MKISYISHGVQFGSDEDSRRVMDRWIKFHRGSGYNVITLVQPNGEHMCVAEKNVSIDTEELFKEKADEN